MNTQEVDALLDRLEAEAQAGNEEELRKFDFISLENPYIAWRRTRQRERASRVQRVTPSKR